MQLGRYIKANLIETDLKVEVPDFPEGTHPDQIKWHIKKKVLEEIVELFCKSGKVSNKKKLFTELLNREKKSSTALGRNVAIPHLRTMQAKDLVIAFICSKEGVEFFAPDNQLVNLFFCLIAPPYNDKVYLDFYQKITKTILNPNLKTQLLEAEDSHTIAKLLSDILK